MSNARYSDWVRDAAATVEHYRRLLKYARPSVEWLYRNGMRNADRTRQYAYRCMVRRAPLWVEVTDDERQAYEDFRAYDRSYEQRMDEYYEGEQWTRA